jgi:hypothetical protein
LTAGQADKVIFGHCLLERKVVDQSQTISRILDELSVIEGRLIVLEKQSHSRGKAASSTREANALKKRQAKLLDDIRRLEGLSREKGPKAH